MNLMDDLSPQSRTLADLDLRPDVDVPFQDLDKFLVSSDYHAVTVLYHTRYCVLQN